MLTRSARAAGRRPVGGPGGADMTTFSLHPVKAITTGEGGLVSTEDDELARRLRLFRTHGITKEGVDPSATDGAWYYEMQAARLQLPHHRLPVRARASASCVGSTTSSRGATGSPRATASCSPTSERIALPPAAPDGRLHAYHLFVVRLSRGAARAPARASTRSATAGIGVQVHYIPIYRHPYYRDVVGYPAGRLSRRPSDYYAGAISLPMFPA